MPRYGDVFPGKYPFRPPGPKNPAPPLVLLSSTQPVRVDSRPDKIKAPEEYSGARIWVMFLDVQICQGFHLFKSLL